MSDRDPDGLHDPVSMRWRLVRAGDVVLDSDEQPWMVSARLELSVGLTFRISQGAVQGESEFEAVTVDPDKIVRVLVPRPCRCHESRVIDPARL